MGNPNPDRQFYDHASGTEVTASNGVFDVPAWRQDTTQDLIDIKDEINDEALANRNNETTEHTSTRLTITTKSDEEQVKLDSIETRLNAPVAVPPNKSATATTTDYALDGTTALKIKDASTTFIHCSISNDNTVGVWLKLQAATVDNVKTGIFIDRGDYWEMPEGALYTGEISAIAESGTPTINVTVY